MEKWIIQLHKHAWWLLDTLKVTSVHKLDSSMKVSPSPVWELALFCIKEPFSQGGREPYFPALKPHREVPYPNYMEMSLVSVSKGGALMSCAAEPRHSAIISEILGHPWEFGCQCAACDVFLTLSLGCLCARRCCQMEKQVSWLRPPTPSPGWLPECATPMCERKSPASSVGAGYQHIGAKSLGSHCVSITVQSVQFKLFLWQELASIFHSSAICTSGLRHTDEGVFLVKLPSVCVSVFMSSYSLR